MTSFTRVCQPLPVAFKAASTSASKRIVVSILVRDFCGPRVHHKSPDRQAAALRRQRGHLHPSPSGSRTRIPAPPDRSHACAGFLSVSAHPKRSWVDCINDWLEYPVCGANIGYFGKLAVPTSRPRSWHDPSQEPARPIHPGWAILKPESRDQPNPPRATR